MHAILTRGIFPSRHPTRDPRSWIVLNRPSPTVSLITPVRQKMLVAVAAFTSSVMCTAVTRNASNMTVYAVHVVQPHEKSDRLSKMLTDTDTGWFCFSHKGRSLHKAAVVADPS